MTNSRLKDYFDLSVVFERDALDVHLLADAIKATFERRLMPLPAGLPIGLSDEFAHDPSHQALWQAFLKKNGLASENLPAIVHRLRVALGPELEQAVPGPQRPGVML